MLEADFPDFGPLSEQSTESCMPTDAISNLGLDERYDEDDYSDEFN